MLVVVSSLLINAAARHNSQTSLLFTNSCINESQRESAAVEHGTDGRIIHVNHGQPNRRQDVSAVNTVPQQGSCDHEWQSCDRTFN